jgi:organic hydroperoxide reductase OsmC/OhrA
MLGTLRGALAARGIRVGKDELRAEVEGLIEKVGSGIKITTIRVHYTLRVPAEKREEAERAVAVHEKGCPASQSVQPGITVEWDATYED